ncbi:MAG: hypothetical protein GX421_12520 [Caldisericales bacterium]|nr:hypothetical protein [Caldisericales bacterium]
MSVVGVRAKAAFRKWGKQDSWELPSWPVSSPGAGHAIPLLSESFTAEHTRDSVNTIYNRAARTAGQIVQRIQRGAIEVQGMYNNLGQLLTCAMGFENPNDPGATYFGSPETSSGKYIHLYELDDALAEEDWSSSERLPSGSGGGTYSADDDKIRCGSLVLHKGIDHAYAPLMWDKMSFQANFESVKLRLEGMAMDVDRENDYSNEDWTLATAENRLLLSDAAFILGDVAGAMLLPTAQALTDFELVMERGLVADYDTQGASYMREPQINQGRKCYGSFSLSRYALDTILNMHDWDASCKAYLMFTSALGTYRFIIYMPNMTLIQPDYGIKGPGVIRPKIQFELAKPASDPWAASSEYGHILQKKLGEFWIVVKNDDPTNWLRTDPS